VRPGLTSRRDVGEPVGCSRGLASAGDGDEELLEAYLVDRAEHRLDLPRGIDTTTACWIGMENRAKITPEASRSDACVHYPR
jgi:hypothetical protein